jgi:uncharacterized membrane protein
MPHNPEPAGFPGGSAGVARIPSVDVARGVALAMMVAYHACFDLANAGLIRQNLYDDARWIAWRSLILGSFLLLAGGSLALSQAAGWQWRRYWRRLLQILGCAALVSAGSYLLFPASWIYFGVLHHLALASVLALPFLHWPRAALAAAGPLLLVGIGYANAIFDQQPWQFIGLMSHKPRTEDYVPLLPWFGLVLCGIWTGSRLAWQPRWQSLRAWQPRSGAARLLAWAGRHSLAIYMIHQPVLIGLLQVAAPRR